MPSKRPRLAEVGCPLLRNAVVAAKVPMAARRPENGSLPLDMMLRSCRWHWSRQQSVKQVECVMRWRSSRWTTKIRAHPSRVGPKLLSAPTPEGSGPVAGPQNPRWLHKKGKLGQNSRPVLRQPKAQQQRRSHHSWSSQPLSVSVAISCSCGLGRYAAAFFLGGPDCFSHHRTPISLTLLFSISFSPAGPACAKHKMASDGSSTVTLDRDYFDLLVRRYEMNSPPQRRQHCRQSFH